MDALTFFPRMARPQIGFPGYIGLKGPGPLYRYEEGGQPELPHDPRVKTSSINQLTILISYLKEVFRSVEPTSGNMQVYGHTIRNVLLLSSMEFENECRGVLTANGYPQPPRDRWTTNDFIKVLAPLRLNEYEVELSHYPTVAARRPFGSWDANAPTSSLGWYNAYNAVKHNRDLNFNQATLNYAIDAICACAIMLTAQYRLIDGWHDQIGGFFDFGTTPEWTFAQHYIYRDSAAGLRGWRPIDFNFS
ncbi:hypothetical protein [Methylobacterium sp. CM6244]